MQLKYVNGDATAPVGDEPKIIVHCVNCLGVMGSGIALTIRKKWPHVFEQYYEYCYNMGVRNKSLLGECKIVKAEKNIAVANLFGQNSTGLIHIGDVDIEPVDYRAIKIGFARLKQQWLSFNESGKFIGMPSLHMPRIACGLAAGRWDWIETIITDVFSDVDIDITVYDYVAPVVERS
jgi:O-acetyl-ADP-ribose deacetylase (regulator of RNase III)